MRCGLSNGKNISCFRIIEHQRHFFINFYYNGCPGDTGWLMVGDKPGNRYVCDWEDYASPVILFSTSSGAVTWGSSPTSELTQEGLPTTNICLS